MRRWVPAGVALTAFLASVAGVVLAGCGGDAGDGGQVTTSPALSATTESGLGPGTSTGDSPASTGVAPNTPGTGTGTGEVAQRTVQVYFVQDGSYARAVPRVVPGTPDVAANAIEALLAGPSEAELEDGLTTAIPADTLLLGLDLDGGVATVDLSRELERGGGSFAMSSRLAQIVYTLTELDPIDEVVFWIDGEPVTVFSGEGILLDGPVSRADYASALPLSAPVPRWSQADLPSTADVPAREQARVVLVAADDVLNARSGAGAGRPIVGMLEPGAVVRRTGAVATAGSSPWAEIVVPGGTAWVNARYLGTVFSHAQVESDPAVIDLLDRTAAIMAAGGDLSLVTSSRGLYVVHENPPLLFRPEELDTILTDPTTYRWGSAALEVDSPELPSLTFAQAVGESFVSTYDDPDTSIWFNQVQLGGNGTLAEHAIPFELTGFNFVSVYDPGDDPQYGGLDWRSWYVSIDYENDRPVVVALTLNRWSP